MSPNEPCLRLGRRAFLRNGSLVLAAATSLQGQWLLAADGDSPPLKVGMVTDLHYADKPEAGTRYYRQTLDKLGEAASVFEEQQPSFIVELGDLIDAADAVDVEQRYLRTINREFSQICRQRHYVLGNHCVDTLTKPEFLAGVEQAHSYYSFDHDNYHFIVLDACFRSDGQAYGRKNSKWDDANIPPEEIEWLKMDVMSTDKRIVVFTHQRLDVSSSHGVKNGASIRRILEASGQVLAVFQGHSHQNDLKEIGGIHYCTLRAMVEGSGAESSGYSLMKLATNGTIEINGFRAQSGYLWGV